MNSSKATTFEDLENLDMKIVASIPWAQSMFSTLEAGYKKAFLNWVQTVLSLSQNEEDIREWKSTFIDQFEERCCEMVTDIQELHRQVILNIEDCLKKIQELSKTLQIDMPVFGYQQLGLYQERLLLKRCIKELEQKIEARQSELGELSSKQLKLCQILGKEPMIIQSNPLPSSNQISDLQKYIEYLEQEKFNREEQYYTIKEKLSELVKELSYVPKSEFERDLISDDETKCRINANDMKALDSFHSKLQATLESVKEEVSVLRARIEQLWTLLDLNFIEREEFRNAHKGNTLVTLAALKTELERCDKLKRANIKVFIEKLRKELLEMWDTCHCSDAIRKEFKFYHSDCYTEDMMELYELQIQKLRTYADENREILALLNKHKSLWEEMIELEKSANGPDRYNNRGGRLLKEERERNLLAKQIPKIEENLRKLADAYEQQYGVPFQTFGQSIEEYIINLHENRNHEKQLKLSARKAQKENVTPNKTSKCVISLYSNTAITSFKRPMGCATVDVKKRKLTPKKLLSERKKKIPLTLSVTPMKRLSSERKTRLEKIRRLSRQKLLKEERNATYIEFENELSNRMDLRSTINAEEAVTCKDPQQIICLPGPSSVETTKYQRTPQKIPLHTPKTPSSLIKSPHSNRKLTSAKSNTKLIF